MFDFMQNVDVDGQQVILEEIDEETGKKEVSVEQIPFELMQKLKVSVKVNVSQTDAYSILAMEQMWDTLFEKQAITFEEWVSGLSDNSKYNKAKLEEIIKKRKETQKQLTQLENEINEEQIQANKFIQEQTNQEIGNMASDIQMQQEQIKAQLEGGQANEMQTM